MSVLRVIVLAATVVSAVAIAAPADQKPKQAAKPAAAQKGGLPQGAEKIGEATWRYKDPQGKVWIYSKSPFGYARKPETAEADEAPKTKSGETARYRVAGVKDGAVTFETKSVFGVSRWTRKVEEMQPDEKASYEAYLQSAKQQ